MHRGGSGRGHGPSQGGLSFPLSAPLAVTPLSSTALSLDMTCPPEPSPPRCWLFQEAFQGCLALVSVVRANKGVLRALSGRQGGR